jgi:predicted enzyme related to lactoylglutathione lyase
MLHSRGEHGASKRHDLVLRAASEVRSIAVTTTTHLVTGVDFVSVPTEDIQAAIEFYAEVLGLERGKLWGKDGEEPLGAEFETGTVTIAVVAGARIGIPFEANRVPIALHVEDVEAARAELESKGVEFLGDIIDSGVCHMANFSDPDGNALMLHHRYAPKA